MTTHPHPTVTRRPFGTAKSGSPRVRHAVPEDLGFLIWVMVEAATSHLDRCVWETVLDGTGLAAEDVVAHVATSPEPHWCHWRRFRVVDIDGRPVAAASSYDPCGGSGDSYRQFPHRHQRLDSSRISWVSTKAAGQTPRAHPPSAKRSD